MMTTSTLSVAVHSGNVYIRDTSLSLEQSILGAIRRHWSVLFDGSEAQLGQRGNNIDAVRSL
jgi:hypothetical protein